MGTTITDDNRPKPEYVVELEKEIGPFIKEKIGKKNGKDRKYACVIYVIEDEKDDKKADRVTVRSNHVTVTNISFRDPHYLVDSAHRIMWNLVRNMF